MALLTASISFWVCAGVSLACLAALFASARKAAAPLAFAAALRPGLKLALAIKPSMSNPTSVTLLPCVGGGSEKTTPGVSTSTGGGSGGGKGGVGIMAGDKGLLGRRPARK